MWVSHQLLILRASWRHGRAAAHFWSRVGNVELSVCRVMAPSGPPLLLTPATSAAGLLRLQHQLNGLSAEHITQISHSTSENAQERRERGKTTVGSGSTVLPCSTLRTCQFPSSVPVGLVIATDISSGLCSAAVTGSEGVMHTHK